MVKEYFAWEGDFDGYGGKKFNQGKIYKWKLSYFVHNYSQVIYFAENVLVEMVGAKRK
jgi:hypothetical protein